MDRSGTELREKKGVPHFQAQENLRVGKGISDKHMTRYLKKARTRNEESLSEVSSNSSKLFRRHSAVSAGDLGSGRRGVRQGRLDASLDFDGL